MRLFLLTALTMTAFAANSVLNRIALAQGSMDAVSFGVVRLVSGAMVLGLLCLVLRGRVEMRGRERIAGVLSLLVYFYGFSLAYRALDAGLGALILFGVVQITMFVGGIFAREAMPRRRWIGAGLAFAGLIWLLSPGAGPQVSVLHGLLMAVAGVGWGVYSLSGRRSGDALMSTAANFIWAAPVGVIVWGVMPKGTEGLVLGGEGIALAIVSGAVTSGLGYALWYSILPRLAASVAAVAQLTVPVIAMAGGMVFLGEALSLAFVLASALVLGGVAISVLPPGRRQARRISSSGS
ncbi:MAG: EamA family transporter [Rhodobacteraceae bacterium CG17_big_fil_post_rev_8_21_14_2_50_63_15]|nr:MAG: EamA family transporter [Rhodobacteraceae bacterium CG17_big_fil_post_rev_8_21_14_2_50_63_15]